MIIKMGQIIKRINKKMKKTALPSIILAIRNLIWKTNPFDFIQNFQDNCKSCTFLKVPPQEYFIVKIVKSVAVVF